MCDVFTDVALSSKDFQTHIISLLYPGIYVERIAKTCQFLARESLWSATAEVFREAVGANPNGTQ